MSTAIHHISILNRRIKTTFNFYHNILGLKLLMKTVNQDDLSMYHLFFSDEQGRPGTEITFFEMSVGREKQFGTNAIERTILKVPSEATLLYWQQRFDEKKICHYGIETYNQRPILRFEGPDGTALGLVPLRETENINDFFPVASEQIPKEHRILAIDAVHLRVHYPKATQTELENLLNWHYENDTSFFDTPYQVTVLSNKNNTFYQEVHLIHDTKSPVEISGVGGVHHVAFSVKDLPELNNVDQQLEQRNFVNSGVKNREFFQSLYFREPNQLLFEVATQEGFFAKELKANATDFDAIPLYLPTFLEEKRQTIQEVLDKQTH